MKKLKVLSIAFVTVLGLFAFSTFGDKLVSSKTHIKFFSTTPAEDIEANNYTAVSTIDKSTGKIVFSVPMQGFEFPKSLMQKHFNQKKFLHTSKYPKAKYVGNITNLSEIDFDSDGTYTANVQGEMTIKGVTNPVTEDATIKVSNGKVSLETKFYITLADYDITFKRGKPSTNIADKVEVTAKAEYK
ncbi:YceI family protein [Psychroflexus sp. MBR-150]|jgi:polyisoprenoid-binding protein YceI